MDTSLLKGVLEAIVHTLGHTIATLKGRWRAWLGFELMVRLVTLALGIALLKLGIDLAMSVQGYAYLTSENLPAFILGPLSLAVFFVLLVLAALFALFELSGLFYVFAADAQAGRLTVLDAASYATARMPGLIRLRNAPIILYLLLLFPLRCPSVAVGILRSLDLLSLIMKYFEKRPGQAMACLCVSVVLVLVALRLVFVTVFFVWSGTGFAEALKRSWAATRGRALKCGLTIAVVPHILTLATSLILLAPVVGLLACADMLAYTADVFGLMCFLASLVVDIPYAFATKLSLLAAQLTTPALAPVPVPEGKGHGVRARWPMLAVVLSIALAGAFAFEYEVVPLMKAERLHARRAQVTGHRGGAAKGPENTLLALERARVDGADWCEIDVRQSKDGVPFVAHDARFTRISGVNRKCWELTFDEIGKLDATGARWKGLVATQRYPLLSEVISWAKIHNVLLNIELKPTKHDVAFEESVVSLVDAKHFWDRCVIASQSYAAIAKVKKLKPQASCVYVTACAYGDLSRLKAADAFSLKDVSASAALVDYLHEHDLPVLAWVANSELSMRSMMANGVDNLITDEVALARSVAGEARTMTFWERLFFSVVAVLSLRAST